MTYSVINYKFNNRCSTIAIKRSQEVAIAKSEKIMDTPTTKVIFILYLYISSISALSYHNSSLHCNYYGNRTCPEDVTVAVFVCRVSGGVATVWRGSIFNCPDHGNEIILRHNDFENEDNTRTCNDRKVVAYSSEVISNSIYSSQLNVTVTPEMHNGTVECIQDDINEIFVGACTLILTTGTVSI